MKNLGYCLVLLYFLINFEALAKKDDKGANKHNPRMNKIFVGEITRYSQFVELDEPLVALDKDAPARSGLICDFKLSPVNSKDSEVFFNVEILNANEGVISLKPNLNLSDCSINQTEFHYYITAYDCGTNEDENGFVDQRKSHQSKLSVSVKETNIYRPTFLFENISLEFTDDIIAGSPLVSLQATDRDCSSRYGDICGYKISGGWIWEKKFLVVNGVLMSKHLIRSTLRKQVIEFKVQSKDCSSLYSKPTYVTIVVLPICHSGWEDVEKRVEFNAMTSSVLLYPQSKFKLCTSSHDVAAINVDVNLQGSECLKQLGNGLRICGPMEKGFINILPARENYNQFFSPSTFQQQLINPLPILTKTLKGEEMYEFNGANEAFIFTDRQLFSSLNQVNLTSNFSVSFRMFLSSPSNSWDKKSTVLCKSDKSGLSRHHFSVYIQNCHLMLLIRREGGKKGSLSPAEWHWKLEGNKKKGCDNNWYDVLINVHFPKATLHLGGIPVTPFLVADDYPLLRSRHPLVWTVGAAWEGRTSETVQHFHGRISGLGISPYLREPNTTRCSPQCGEGIKAVQGFNRVVGVPNDERIPETTVHLSFATNSVKEMTAFLKSVVYFNSGLLNSKLDRSISLTTNIECHSNATKCPYIPPKVISLSLTPTDPQILIEGKGQVVRSTDDLERSNGRGVYLFDDITFMTQRNNEFDVNSIEPQQFIDYCVISESNDIGLGRFHVRPQQILRDNQLEMERQPEGVTLRGTHMLSAYENVFQSLMYTNQHAASLTDSSFKVTCFKTSGNFHSNEYVVKLEILHPNTKPPLVAKNNEEVVVSLVSSDGLHDGSLTPHEGARVELEEAEREEMVGKRLFQIGNDPTRKDYTTPIIMAGSGIILLTLLVVAGVFHVRLQGGDGEADIKDVDEERVIEEGDLDWDDSAMTITINPMENSPPEASDDDFSELDEDDVTCDHVRETHLIGCKSHDPALLERHIRRPEDYYKWEG